MIVHLYFDVFDEVTLRVLQSVREWRLRSVKIWTNRDEWQKKENRQFLANIREGVRIIDDAPIDYGKDLYEWHRVNDSVSRVEKRGIRALASRVWDYGSCVVGIGSLPKEKDLFIGFFDRQGDRMLPKEFFRIDWLTTSDALEGYLKDKGFGAFSLKDENRFERTGMVYEGTPIFREKSTGRYVYLDTLHKDHYEVFDPRGCHIGEFSLTGVLDQSKKDKNKHLRV